jgi:two-component system chemotaxis sensor kinase CheA
LALTTALLVLVVSAGVYVVLTRYERRSLLEAKQEAARAVARLLAEVLSAPVVFGDDEGVKESLVYLESNPEVVQALVVAVDANGKLGRDLGKLPSGTEAPWVMERPRGADQDALRMTDDALDATHWVRDKAGTRIALAGVRFSLEREKQRYELLARRVLQFAFALASGLTLLLLMLARVHIINPLRALHLAVRKVAAGGASDPQVVAKLAGQARDEVGDLARDFVGMAEAIARREAAIARQNDDMRLVLESVGQGFLVLALDGRVDGHHSAVLDSWFGPVKQGQLFWEYMGAHDAVQAEWLELVWSNVGAPHMPLELCVEQMPKRFSARERSYDIEYRPRLASDGSLRCMVVVITDVTELVIRQRAEMQQRELVGIVGRLLSDRSGFMSFYESAKQLVTRLAQDSERDRNAILQDLHTLKGNAGLFELRGLSRLCEDIEERCATAHDVPSAAERALLAQTFELTGAVVERFLADRDAPAFSLSAADYAALEAAIKAGDAGERLLLRLARANGQPAQQVLGGLAAQLEVLARSLDKCPVQVTVQAPDLRFPRVAFAPLWSSLVHVLRNIADHGLETSWEREQTHKPATANITLRAELAGDWLTLSFSDDGRGVDCERLKERVRQQGLRAETQAELLATLFVDGITTRSTAGAVSGRGVGLAAVKAVVDSLSGRISLTTELGRGTNLFIQLPAELLAA